MYRDGGTEAHRYKASTRYPHASALHVHAVPSKQPAPHIGGEGGQLSAQTTAWKSGRGMAAGVPVVWISTAPGFLAVSLALSYRQRVSLRREHPSIERQHAVVAEEQEEVLEGLRKPEALHRPVTVAHWHFLH